MVVLLLASIWPKNDGCEVKSQIYQTEKMDDILNDENVHIYNTCSTNVLECSSGSANRGIGASRKYEAISVSVSDSHTPVKSEHELVNKLDFKKNIRR